MSLIKRLFFAIFACVGVVCFSMQYAFGLLANSCNTGGEYQYCGFGRSCRTCPANCYCPPRNDPGSVSCTGWTGLKCESGVLKSNTNHTESQGSFGVYACPADFPYSTQGSTDVKQCYKVCVHTGGRGPQITNEIKTCKKGEFLPYEKNACASCKTITLQENEVCPGGSFSSHCTKNQGIKKCEAGEMPNADRTACVPQIVSCSPGMYLPKGEKKCRSCPPTNVYCPGIKDVSVDKTKDQGIFSCPDGTKQVQNRQSCDGTTCQPGFYLPGKSSTCKECPAGKACSGGTFGTRDNDQGTRTCPPGTTVNSSQTDCENISCPANFPETDSSTKSAEDCFKTCTSGHAGGKGPKIKNKKVHCNKGWFLRYEQNECTKCSEFWAVSQGMICPEAIDVYPSCSENQGTVKCEDGMEPNADRTACVSVRKEEPKQKETPKTATCSVGFYLPSGSSTCKTCLDGHACKGGNFIVKSGDQGIVECKVGYETVSDDKSRCIVTAAKCAPGFYLKANKDKCSVCEGANKYCPGGDFELADYDQGIHSCPINGNVNGDRSGCKIKLSKTSMYYGLGGKNTNYMDQCWSNKSIEEYKVCLFGIQD